MLFNADKDLREDSVFVLVGSDVRVQVCEDISFTAALLPILFRLLDMVVYHKRGESHFSLKSL
jgi:hypothetical protein